MAEYRLEQCVLYKSRWLIQLVCCIVALSNAMQWMSYSVLVEQSNHFYCSSSISNCVVSYVTNQIFQITAAITGLAGMYITDKFGIKTSLLSSALLNCIGCGLRLFSSHPFVRNDEIKQSILYTGSVIAASAQAFFLVLPAKIAEFCFPEDQRALANVLSFIANPLGVAVGAILPLAYFKTSADVMERARYFELFNYNCAIFLLTAVGFALSIVIPSYSPQAPTSLSTVRLDNSLNSFLASISICLRNRQFVIQMFVFSMGFALFWTYMMMLPEILIAKKFMITPYIMSIATTCGTIFSLFVGKVVDKTKKIKEIMKILAIGVFMMASVNRLFLLLDRQTFWADLGLISIVSFLGMFSIPQFPIGLELGVETTFPVLEATSSGLLVLASHSGMFLLYAVVEFVKYLDVLYEHDSSQIAGNWQLVLDVWLCCAFITAIICVFAVNPKYRRMSGKT